MWWHYSSAITLTTLVLGFSVTRVQVAPIYYHYDNPFRVLTTFVTSASTASASSPSFGNIADYTRVPKSTQLSLDDDPFFKDNEDSLEQNESDSQPTNDASPSLIQKKVSKILAKLRFLSMLFEDDTTTTSTVETPRDKNVTRIKISRISQFGKPKDEVEAISVTEIEVSMTEPTTKKSVTRDKGIDYYSKEAIQAIPRTIGVFFTELLGSLVGLAYGAAAQLNNPGTTTAPLLP